MTKKRSEGGFAARISAKYDLQPDMMLDGCHLELRGRSSLAVGGCRGIVEYSPIEITLRLRDSILKIAGEHLSCDSYTCGEVLISGRINILGFDDTKR